MKNLLISFLTAIFLCITISEKAEAQWSIGAAYEMRNEDPTNGFGFRVERDILSGLPVLDLNIRGHFSYFNETNDVSWESISYSGDMDVYDFGIAAVAGVSLGIVKPFAGLGIGSERFKQDAEPDAITFNKNNFYWNGFAGAEFDLLPYLKPFIEYRIDNLTSADDVTYDNVGRLAIGLNLRF